MEAVLKQQREDGELCHQAALEYLAKGWSVLPNCSPGHIGMGLVNKSHVKQCANQGKTPWIKWAEYAERLPTVEEVNYWWKQYPLSNVGSAMGPVSRMIRIDVEGLGGEETLRRKSKGDLPDTLQFSSGRLDQSGKGWLYGIPLGIEIRSTYEKIAAGQEVRFQAKGMQTVLPPSRHVSGSCYQWLPGHGPNDIEIATMPEWLILELSVGTNGHANRRTADEWDHLLAGVEEGARNDTAAAVAGKLLAAIGDLNNKEHVRMALSFLSAWNERNDPPMTEEELRKTFFSILRLEVEQRARADQSNLDKIVARQVESSVPSLLQEANGEMPAEKKEPPLWHLIIITSDPPEYLIRSPFWSDKPALAETNGYLRVKLKEIEMWTGLRRAALAQAETRIPDKIKAWGALLDRLLSCAEHRSSAVENRRPLLVAEYLWHQLSRAKDVRKDDSGALNYGGGSPMNLGDGRVIVKSHWLVAHAAMTADSFSRKELLDAMESYGMKAEQFGAKGARSRWWTINQVNLKRLEEDAIKV
jgi:hypothetical protein